MKPLTPKYGQVPQRNPDAGRALSPDERRAIWQRDNGTCQDCGRKGELGVDKHSLQIHHIIPRDYSGTHDPDNLILLCRKCHAKHDRPFREKSLRLRQRNERRLARKFRPHVVAVHYATKAIVRGEDQYFCELPRSWELWQITDNHLERVGRWPKSEIRFIETLDEFNEGRRPAHRPRKEM
jgi:hypothetical protein